MRCVSAQCDHRRAILQIFAFPQKHEKDACMQMHRYPFESARTDFFLTFTRSRLPDLIVRSPYKDGHFFSTDFT